MINFMSHSILFATKSNYKLCHNILLSLHYYSNYQLKMNGLVRTISNSTGPIYEILKFQCILLHATIFLITQSFMIVHPELKIKSHLLLADDIDTLYNVWSVHRGMFSTLGVFSTLGGYHEYIRGIS